MELKNLLSVVIATLTVLGAMLFAMGSQNVWLAIALWMAAVVSLVVTDFLGAVRVPRNLASLLILGVLAIFLPHFLLQSSWDNRLQTVASLLICLQMALLFQEKDPRVYGWLAVMSLLQVVVAAGYNQGVLFGGLLMTYAIVGIFALSLLALHTQWRLHFGGKALSPPSGEGRLKPTLLGSGAASARWPLAAVTSDFTSTPANSGRSGVAAEWFARVTLVAVGALFLAAIIFSTAPRHQLSAWRGDSRNTIATVGFNDQITLGGLGEILESPQEVMQLKLIDPATRQDYTLRDEAIYLRGSVVAWYSHNHWRPDPPPNKSESGGSSRRASAAPYNSSDRRSRSNRLATGGERNPATFHIGPAVEQQITMEPYLDGDDLFYVWPLVEPVESAGKQLVFDRQSGRLERSGRPRGEVFTCKIVTSGLVNGYQVRLVPASAEVRVSPYLQMPGDRAALPRLTALAARWLRESGLRVEKQYDVACQFERQLSGSGQFTYTLQGPERDTSIDAIEDFVSSNPRGDCEYFATALALMLRSQGIPARVVLGYRCDEWHEAQRCYQVRQLHAHAWVEAFLSHDQIPESLRRGAPLRWMHGGWLRLDATPAADVGTLAAQSTWWGAWQGRWHGVERYWEKYIVDMDRTKQRESVYEPIFRAARDLAAKMLNPHWWSKLAAGLWGSLGAMLRSGMMGWLLGVTVLIALVIAPLAALGWLVRRLARIFRRIAAARGPQRGGARQRSLSRAIEFYHRFEQIAGGLGLQRAAGQTPREFARAAGTRLAAVSGRGELYARAVQVADAFYSVRFGQRILDISAAQTVEQALAELTAGAENNGSKLA